MSNPHQYIALVASLPHLGRLFSRKEVQISHYRLRQRLAMLTSEHNALLKDVVEVTAWAGVAKYEEDTAVLMRAKDVVSKLDDYVDIQHLVGSRMETRTLIAALRRRRDGQESAGNIETWGYGRWCHAIKSNWNDPAFGLGHFMPWIAEAHRMMQSEDHIAMERLVLTEVFRQLGHYEAVHEFDFEAVCIYVLRWVIVQRWSQYNTDNARERLKTLLTAALSPSAEAPQSVGPGDFYSDSPSSFEGVPS